MSFLAEFHFLRPLWLLAVPAAAWLWWRLRVLRDPLAGWRVLIERPLLDALTVGVDRRRRWRGVGLLVAWLAAILSLAGPTWRPEPSPFADDPVPVMVVLRAGESMNAEDLAPSRMERARLKVADLAAARSGQPLGLVAYAGSAHLVLPPTRDTALVATLAEEVAPAIMPVDGDDLAAALELADRTLGGQGGSIVVIADTVALEDDPALAAFRSQHSGNVRFLAVARSGTSELEALEHAASTLDAGLTLLTPDDSDIEALVRAVARTPRAVGATGGSVRWAEDGWWLVPLVAMLLLASFRRDGAREATERPA
jgi:Ca-activated chloride channel family protein